MTVSSLSDKGRTLSSPKKTILVVDDERIIRELCERALRNYRVFQAANCDEALQIYKKEQIDLVLSDMVMPGGSGIDLLKQIKALDPNAPVIIMTGFVEKETILNALKEDADDFINKPLSLLQLKTSIEKTLEKKALKEELAAIKRADELKRAFLSLVSHKFRTPITGISLFLQNLRMGVLNPGDPLFGENIKLASTEADYLGQLVTDLLAFSQVMVSDTAVDKKPCNLNEIVAEVLLKCQEMHCDIGNVVDFIPEELPPVPLDAFKTRFALLQVIDNAIKFSGDGCRISVKAGMCEDTAEIVVSDCGVGISESEATRVFDKFYQIDPANTGQVRGFGLGLFYARDFIRQQGGSITLASKPGVGTTVTIRLPLQ
ncbi:MAG: response regulator [Desulfuromonadaceae bacterium]|nr:response regulator [Desulfuromonadaceae bacterium]MDD5105049.1 response regulator [Desulfuromonadaceae bacterium]